MPLPDAPVPVLSPARLAAAYSYAAYRRLIDELLAEGRTTGPVQTAELTHYTTLNVQRMSRLDKTVQLQPALAAAAASLVEDYIWLIITEGWCGDAAQLVPVFEAVAQASAGRLRTAYLLRDDNPDLMDRYLTGTSRAIPRLVMLRADTLVEAAQWGPRPRARPGPGAAPAGRRAFARGLRPRAAHLVRPRPHPNHPAGAVGALAERKLSSRSPA